jgi:hypothetical protein
MGWALKCVEDINDHRILFVNPKGKRQPGRQANRRENDITIDFEGMGYEDVD